jgi:hypothetical protein
MFGIRRSLVFASALTLLPAAAYAEDPYADFRVPEHRRFSWFVQANGSANSFQGNSPNSTTHDTSPSGQLLSQMVWSHESDARLSNLAFTAQARTFQDHRRFTASSPVYEQSGHQWDNFETLSLSVDQRNYLGDSRFAVEGDASLAYVLAQRGNSAAGYSQGGTFEDFNGDEQSLHSYRPSGSVTLGIGYGRVRDATGVYSAQLIEQRLHAMGRLTRALSPAARTRIAQLHYIAGDFLAAHDRPSRYFWQEVERVLNDDGALAEGGLDAYSLLRLLEPSMGGRGYTRLAGGFVRPFFFGSQVGGHEDLDTRSSRLVLDSGTVVFAEEAQSSQRTELDQKDSGVGLGLEYHRPGGMRWQTDASAVSTYGGGPRRELDVSSVAQVQYLIADRWFALARLDYQSHSQELNGARSEPEWTLAGRTSLSYLVEDSWSLDLQCSSTQQQRRNEDFFTTSFVRVSGISFGLTYRPYGRFEAPGLNIAQRLITPPL